MFFLIKVSEKHLSLEKRPIVFFNSHQYGEPHQIRILRIFTLALSDSAAKLRLSYLGEISTRQSPLPRPKSNSPSDYRYLKYTNVGNSHLISGVAPFEIRRKAASNV